MNQGMWHKQSTQANLAVLKKRGVHILGPAEGSQACGDIGQGRMLEPTELTALTAGLFTSASLQDKVVVVTAGPTREAIDPVRYISNHSSGKMGYALAEAAAEAGAKTFLISGPTGLPTPDRVNRIDVTSADQMLEAVMSLVESCDLFIGAAAVADYRPAQQAMEKIKKAADTMVVELVKNPDIISAVASHPARPFTVGFAAETSDVEKYAQDKLSRKKLDAIIANDVSREDIGFNSDMNQVLFVDSSGVEALPKCSKSQLARQLIDKFSQRMKQPRKDLEDSHADC
jgi:phosphopantothenoylcysteine decarboxylase/phosphopantothenate--cysteine ligase